MEMKTCKPGDSFERLVECISKHLHEKAIITRNDKLRDIHTGKIRQIDLTIRVEDGPTKFLAIVEARDRSRKIGVDYIEQIKSKKDSVAADKAIVVSNRGFCETALKKAKIYGIETYSLIEAMEKDWSSTFSLFQGFVLWSCAGDYTIFFLDDNMNVIDVHESVSDVLQADKNAKIILDQNGKPKLAFSSLLNPLNGIKDLTNVATIHEKHPIQVLISGLEKENLFFCDEFGKLRQIKAYLICGNIWKTMKTYKPVVKHYKDENTGRLLEEVIGANDSGFQFEILHNRETQAISLRKKF